MFNLLKRIFGTNKGKNSGHIEFDGLHGAVSLKSKQYPYMVDDPRTGIVTDAELRVEISKLADLPFNNIVCILGKDGVEHFPEDYTLLQILDMLKNDYTAIPF